MVLSALYGEWGLRRHYLVMALGIRNAFLSIAPVGQSVHDGVDVPVFILEFLQDLLGKQARERTHITVFVEEAKQYFIF